MQCQACGCEVWIELGFIGNRRHLRCRNCGMDTSTLNDKQEEKEE